MRIQASEAFCSQALALCRPARHPLIDLSQIELFINRHNVEVMRLERELLSPPFALTHKIHVILSDIIRANEIELNPLDLMNRLFNVLTAIEQKGSPLSQKRITMHSNI